MSVSDGQSSPKLNATDKEQGNNRNHFSAPIGSSLRRLRSSCIVVRMDDVDIHQVSSCPQLVVVQQLLWKLDSVIRTATPFCELGVTVSVLDISER